MKGGLAETADVAVRVGYFLPGDLSLHGFQPLEFRGDAFPEPRDDRRAVGRGNEPQEIDPGNPRDVEVPLGELTPRAITSLMARMRGAGDEEITRRVGELFEQLDIAEWADQPGNKLSGGVLRLTCFCMAAIRPGRVVVLDEPTNDVDPVRRRYLWGAIRELTGDGTAVLLVTHNIGEAEGAVDEMAIMDHGRVLARGNASRIKASTVGDDMKLQAFTTAPPEAFGQPGWVGNIEVRNGELIVSFPRDRAVDALTWAAELRGRRLVGDYSLREMSLEDTYVQLVGDREVDTDAH